MFKRTRPVKRWQLSIFEKVILANSLILIGEALAGLWVTSHNIETRHYFIDTGFIVLATLIGLVVNIFLLRASFRPLFTLLAAMRAVSKGKTDERVTGITPGSEIGELAHTFNTMLDSLEAARREQSLLILQAQEEERRRLALELHDESSQNLTALLVHIEVLKQTLRTLPDTASIPDTRRRLNAELDYLTGITQQTLEDIRVLAQQLRPSVLDDLGLQAAFRWLAEDVRQRLQLSVELHIENIEHALQGNAQQAIYETTLFRIAQESLTNVARHAHAQHVSISLVQQREGIHLRIHDDGNGFDPSAQKQGLGIFSMRERAALLDGTIHIEAQPGRGTTIEAVLPLSVKVAKGNIHA
ncbi:MAG TPA: sensor histidine kinase [Ktedonobacteraceae bacterium]|nr:sensor histidine kinase [Ktedonobacteraceae bacterium]